MSAIACQDCDSRPSSHVPVDRFRGGHDTRLLCLGCLTGRRGRGETWVRVARQGGRS